jgi:hypothetical protein
MADLMKDILEDVLGPLDGRDVLKEAEAVMADARALSQRAQVNPVAVRDHLQNLAASFFTERLRNASSIEKVRALAAEKLLAKIDDETSPSQLMRILESLSELNGVDFTAVLQAISGGGKPGTPGAGNTTNIFNMGQNNGVSSHALPPGTTSDSVRLTDSLVQVAEAVISKQGPGQDVRARAAEFSEQESDDDDLDA